MFDPVTITSDTFANIDVSNLTKEETPRKIAIALASELEVDISQITRFYENEIFALHYNPYLIVYSIKYMNKEDEIKRFIFAAQLEKNRELENKYIDQLKTFRENTATAIIGSIRSSNKTLTSIPDKEISDNMINDIIRYTLKIRQVLK